MKLIKFILIVSLFSIYFPVNSQTLHSTYFLEGNNQRDELNPAFEPDRNFVTFPGLGNVYINANSNIGLKALIRPYGDEMITFLHPSISVDDAMKQFKDNNIVELDANINIFKIGFKKWGGTNTISLNAKSQSGAYIPKTIFEFLKAGQAENGVTEYNAKDINVLTQNYVELSLGHSRKINSRISIGAKFKILLGAAYSKAHIDNINISMSSDEWTIKQNSSLIGSKGMNFQTKADGEIDKIKFDNFGVAGWGLGADLGISYKINNNANISFAITDIGFINWSNCQNAVNKNKSFRFEGFDNIADENSKDFEDAADAVWEDLKGMVKYYQTENKSETTSLYSTLRLGGEYGILNNKISFGVLGSIRLGAPKVWAEGMISANFRPCNWFNAALNGSVSNIHSSLGTVLNFHPKAVNVFVGMDYFLASYSAQFIPTNAAKFNIALGISFNY